MCDDNNMLYGAVQVQVLMLRKDVDRLIDMQTVYTLLVVVDG